MSTGEDKDLQQVSASFMTRSKRIVRVSMLVSIFLSVVAASWVVYASLEIPNLERQISERTGRISELTGQISELTGQRDGLITQVTDLTSKKAQLLSEIAVKERWQADVTIWKSNLVDTTKSLTQSLASGNTSPRTEAEIERANNALYAIGFYGFRISRDEFDRAYQALNRAGYTISRSQSQLLPSQPVPGPWFAERSTVFFYAESSREKAISLSRELARWTDSDFVVQRGYGRGVVEGQEQWTFFVHYVGRSQ